MGMCSNKYEGPYGNCYSVLEGRPATPERVKIYTNCLRTLKRNIEMVRGKRYALAESFSNTHEDFYTWVCASIAAIILLIGLLFAVRHRLLKARIRRTEKEDSGL